MRKRTRRFRRRLLLAALTAGVALAVVAGALKLLVAPYLVRRHLRQALGEVWIGTVGFEGVEFDLAGAVRLYGLELIGPAGRRWLRVGQAKLGISNWMTGAPAARDVELADVVCDLHFTDGRCTLPLKVPSVGTFARPELERLTASEVVLRIMKAGRPATAATYKGMQLKVDRKAESYEVLLERKDDRAGETWRATGTYDWDSKVADVSLAVEHVADVAETNAWFGALGWDCLAAVQGKLSGSAALRGRVDRPLEWEHSLEAVVEGMRIDAPDGLIVRNVALALTAADGKGRITSVRAEAPPGRIHLGEVKLTYELSDQRIAAEAPKGVITLARSEQSSRFWDNVLAGVGLEGTVSFTGSLDYDRGRSNPLLGSVRAQPEGLEATIPVKGPLLLRRLRWNSAVLTPVRLEVTGLSAEACGGELGGELGVDHWADARQRRFQLLLKASGADLAELSKAAGVEAGRAMTGNLDLHLELAGGEVGWRGLTGRGRIHIRGGDFWSVPVVGDLFDRLRLPKGPAAISQARGVFSVTGPELEVRHAALTNRLAGIECTGGTVNLQSRQVDVSVVAGTFLTLNPVGRLLVGDIKAKLLARRVRGRWDALRPESFAPLPVDKIADTSVAFLGELARHGGKFGTGIIKGFETLFRSLRPRVTGPSR